MSVALTDTADDTDSPPGRASLPRPDGATLRRRAAFNRYRERWRMRRRLEGKCRECPRPVEAGKAHCRLCLDACKRRYRRRAHKRPAADHPWRRPL